MVPLVIASLFILIIGSKINKLLKPMLVILFSYLIFSYPVKDLSSFFCYVSILVFFSSILYTFQKKMDKDVEFYSLMVLLLASILGVINSENIVYSFIYFEMMCLISYILVAFEKRRESLKAALKYMYFGILGSYLMIWGIGYYFSGNYKLFSLFFLLGISVEMAIFPLSLWLPDAHSEAKTPISSVLSGAVIEAAMVFFYKIYTLYPFMLDLRKFIVFPALFGTIFPAVSSLRENDPKRILAYSSVMNMGISLTLLISGKPTIFFYYLIFHSVSKSLSFLSLGPLVERFGRDIDKLNGRELLYSSIPLLFSLLSLIGFPPLLGFFAKIFALICLVNLDLIAGLSVAISMAIFVYPYMRIIEKIVSKDGKNREKFSISNLSQIFLLIILLYLSLRGVLECMSG